MTHKKLICLDFDGVLHSYSSGWQGCDKIADGPVPGAMEFLRRLVEDGRFDVVVHSSRCSDPAGIEAIKKWLAKHIMGSAPSRIDGDFLVQDGEFDGQAIFEAIRVVDKKPPAVVTLDDRAITFDGTWPALDKLASFVPWNKRPAKTQIRFETVEEARAREAEEAAFELTIADVLAEEDDETDAPIADQEENGAMYRKAFARAEERVAARREIERLRAVIDRAGALAAQNASSEMIRSTLAEAVASSRVSSEIPDEYKWDVEDRGRGPFGEAGTGRD